MSFFILRSLLLSYTTKTKQTANTTFAYQIFINQKVQFNTHNLKTLQSTKKLDWKNCELFKIKEIVNLFAYHLRLLESMKLYLVFYVSLLCPSFKNLLLSQINKPLSLIKVHYLQKQEVKNVLNS